MTSKLRPIYFFGGTSTEGNASMRDELGGKGANLAGMSLAGIPVPPGFTIATHECRKFAKNGNELSAELRSGIFEAITKLESICGGALGSSVNPLLVSVRSGAKVSMPGMMDTILNLGLNDETVAGLASRACNKRFAYDSYRRFIQMYSDVVLGVEQPSFENIIDDVKLSKGIIKDADLTAEDWENITFLFKDLVQRQTGRPFPQDVKEQLISAVAAVFESWFNDRAVYYRKKQGISESTGTAVNVQSMVFGNMGGSSGTGVVFTRNPSSGERGMYGEYLDNAQGEDVVAGIRNPGPISKAPTGENGYAGTSETEASLEEKMPDIYQQLVETANKLEQTYCDMQDVEFTVQEGKLWLLQTRSGKRTVRAAVKSAVDMVHEGLIDKETAIRRIEPEGLDSLLHRALDEGAASTAKCLVTGLPASPGAAIGEAVFSCEGAFNASRCGKKVILIRNETTPEDIEGMFISEGILTARGGMTSHAAVVARGIGRTCITGAKGMRVDSDARTASFEGGGVVSEGDLITIDGNTGRVYLGALSTQDPEFSDELYELMGWADDLRTMQVRANAETVQDAETALRFGAEGIGLCRTEHMFFAKERVALVRKLIIADNENDNNDALEKLFAYQKGDFAALLKVMKGRPINIRLLDPPLHEFLPTRDSEIEEVAEYLGLDVGYVKHRISSLHEVNPMLGNRGCRLGIMRPDIYKMQVRAIVEAAEEVALQGGERPNIEVMVPLVISREELAHVKRYIEEVLSKSGSQNGDEDSKDGRNFDLKIGTMIEVPRAALLAGEIAEEAEYFSFGTNDLTQTALGMSRDDSSSFLNEYVECGILKHDPFSRIDEKGVGELVQIAIERGKNTRPDLKVGICGEHGGDAGSISFFAKVGMDYVSCSPYRVPIARLACAISQLSELKT